MKIAIISFQDNTDIIGAKYIHSFLISHGYESYLILQPNIDVVSDNVIFEFIERNNVDLVGISLMSNEFFRAVSFAEKLKGRFGSIPLVFGGIHGTIAPEECLTVGDFVIMGEGEHTFLNLIRSLETDQNYFEIPGLCFKKGGVTKMVPLSTLEHNLDVFPFPQHLPRQMYVVHKGHLSQMNRALFNSYSRYNGAFPSIITTRGCPFSCTYCCNSVYTKLYGGIYNQVRKRSVASVISECMEIINQTPNCLSLNVQDDCFLAYDQEWLDDFSLQYSNKIKLPFVIRTTPKHVTKQKLAVLKNAGLIIVMIGLQSGSDNVNREVYKRYVRSSDFIAATKLIKDAGLIGYYDLILDNPYESVDDILTTFDVILTISKPFQFQLFSLCFYQGTELNERAKKDGISFTDPRLDHYGIIEKNTLNKLMRMVPTIPNNIMRHLIKNRNNSLVILLIGLLEIVNNVALRPFSFLKMMHKAYGSKLILTCKLIKAFSRSALNIMFIKPKFMVLKAPLSKAKM